jgi:hypothetical protein
VPGLPQPESSDSKAKNFNRTVDQVDPMHSVKIAKDAVKSVERVGMQTIGGTDTDHYKVVVDTAAMLKQMAPGAAQQAGIPDTLTYDMWLDGRHLLRRLTFKMQGVNYVASMISSLDSSAPA